MSSRSMLERWEDRTEWPLACIAVAFLAAYSVKVLGHPGGLTASVLQMMLSALWAAFAIDYLIRLTLAQQRRRWFIRHLLDFLIVAVPFIRPLRMLRLVVIIAALLGLPIK